MAIEQAVVCDICAEVIAAAGTIAKARKEAREQCGAIRRGGQDICRFCSNRPDAEETGLPPLTVY